MRERGTLSDGTRRPATATATTTALGRRHPDFHVGWESSSRLLTRAPPPTRLPDALAEAHGLADFAVERDLAGLEHHDDRRAEAERAELVAALDRRRSDLDATTLAAPRASVRAIPVRAREPMLPTPRGADHDDCDLAEPAAFERDHDALVASEQPIAPRCDASDSPATARPACSRSERGVPSTGVWTR